MDEDKKSPSNEILFNELPDIQQLNFLLESTLLHSDFTQCGADADRIRRILKKIEEELGTVTNDDLVKVFKTREQLSSYFRKYGSDPWRLQDFLAGVLDGSISLTGGQEKRSMMQANSDSKIDLLGLFVELTERFKFKKGVVYQALAVHLDIYGHKDKGDNNAYSVGAEKVRQSIVKLKKQLEITSKKSR